MNVLGNQFPISFSVHNYEQQAKREKLSKMVNSASMETQARVRRHLASEYNMREIVPISELNPQSLETNLMMYELVQRQEQQLADLYVNAYQYNMPTAYLYMSPQKKKLQLSEFLNVAKYAVSIADILGFNTGQISSVLTGLKVVNRAVTGEQISRKDISLAAEVIGEAAKHYAKNDEERKQVTIASTVFSLSVDYLKNQR